ncbi:MAG: Crp/Fnr family transcriptional regulator [Clostridiales bacterium]|nr:Crp/Fnr family transcriptional regulator [Clostridiales bacterium]
MNETIQEMLSSLFLFQGMDFAVLEGKFHILSKGVTREYHADEILLSTREEPLGLAVLTDGSAQILSEDEKRPALLRTINPGDSFGAASLFSRERNYRTCVRAIETCRVFYMPTPLVQEICLLEPAAAQNYIAFLSDRISFLNRKITAFTAGSARERLILYLLHLPLGPDGSWELDVSYGELSEQLGVGRASLYRAMDSLCEAGYIERNKKKVTPLQMKNLELMIQ